MKMRVRRRGRDAAGTAVDREFSLSMLLGGLAVAAFGGVQMLRYPSGSYSNYWGGAVFAPLVLGVGVLLMVLSPFKLKLREVDMSAGQEVAFPHEDVGREWKGH
jgi:hypothetical protein